MIKGGVDRPPFLCYNQEQMFGGENTKNAYIPEDRAKAVLDKLGGVDRLITLLLIETGFRLDDVMHLRTYQLMGDVLSLRERKTGKDRSVPLSSELAEKLRAYAVNRHRLSFAFPALRKGGRKKMHRCTYWRHFCAAVKQLGWQDCGYNPHSLRKIYAVRRLAETRSIYAVQKDLNHSNIAVTAIYALSDRF